MHYVLIIFKKMIQQFLYLDTLWRVWIFVTHGAPVSFICFKGKRNDTYQDIGTYEIIKKVPTKNFIICL